MQGFIICCPSGAFGKLNTLNLDGNKITVNGMSLLANACAKFFPVLADLKLENNPGTRDGAGLVHTTITERRAARASE